MEWFTGIVRKTITDMLPAILAVFMLAQMPQPFAFMGTAGTPTPTPTPTGTPTPTPTPTQVATPVITPAGGTSPQVVSITCATSGAIIFYTLSAGGTNPTHSGATPLGSTIKYSGPFNTGSGNKQVRALGYKAGLTDSTIKIAFFSTGE